jgi:L-alanine-DL-glutamate epimerase-like enolase superfamily enzyme
MARIVSVEARTVRVPLDRPTAFARRQVTGRDYGLVRVRTDDGLVGIGHCYAGHAGGKLVAQAVRELLAPVLLGRDSNEVELLWKEMYQEALLHGRAGSTMRAISILDIALWDRNAQAAKLPLYQYLGAATRDPVPAYASGGYYIDGKTPKHLGEEMAHYVSLGFDAVKMKVGREDPKCEEKRIAAVREAVGPDVLVMLDANNAWSDVPTALRYMERFAPYDPYWIEEPFSPDQIDNHAKLAAAIGIPVATGEIEVGRWRHKELLDKQGAAILQTDAAVCGGITEFRKIAALADCYGVNMCPHWFHDLHVHLVAAAPNGQFVEFFADDQVLNFRKIIDRQLTMIPHKGLKLPTDPGLGYAFDEAAIAKCEADAWA